MKGSSDWTRLTAAIKSYSVTVKVVKQYHFSAPIASAEYHPSTLLRITRSLLGQGGGGQIIIFRIVQKNLLNICQIKLLGFVVQVCMRYLDSHLAQ